MKFTWLSMICLLSILTVSINAQTENLERLFEDENRSTLEKISQLKDIYSEGGSLEYQMQTASLLVRAFYATLQNNEVGKWVGRVDSMANLMQEGELDFDYLMTKAAWLNGVKKTAASIDLLHSIKEDVFSTQDTALWISWNVQLSRGYIGFDDKAEALKYLTHAQELNNVFKDQYYFGQINKQKAAIAWEEKDLEKSLDYNFKAAEIFKDLGFHRALVPVYADIITLYVSLGKPKLADPYRNRLSELHKLIGCNRCYFSNELNHILFKVQEGEFMDAVTMADSLYAFAEINDFNTSHIYYLKGLAYRGLNDYNKAAPLIEKAFDISKSLKHNGKSQFYAHALYQTYYWKDRFEPALLWYQTYTTFKDSVYNEKKATEIAVYEARLEALEEKHRVEELQTKIEVEKQKKKTQWVIFTGVLLLLLASIYVLRSRAILKQEEQKLIIERLEVDRALLEQKLIFKEKEVTSQLLNLAQKNQVLQEVHQYVQDLQAQPDANKISKLIFFIERSLSSNEQWQALITSIQTIHASFYEKLKGLSLQLSANDLRLASLIKLNLNSKEIAALLNISDAGVKKARYRLRKKMNIDSEMNIHDYILNM